MLTFAVASTGSTISVQEIYDAKARGERPPACFCLACQRPLIAKLGVKVAHHFAHQPHPEPCFGSTGEGELHLSAKAFLQKHLQALADVGGALFLESACRDCEQQLITPAFTLQPGDQVRVESWADPRKTLKPDVTLYRGEAQIGFIEVLVTHACEPQKLAALKELGVPLVEVRGEQVMDEHQLETTHLQFPFARVLGIDIPKRCPPCRERERLEREARERADKEWEEREEVEGVAHWFVHFFMENGHRFLKLLVLARYWKKGRCTSAALFEQRTGEKIGSWDAAIAEDSPALLERARAAAREHCRPKANRPMKLETYGGFRRGPPGEEPLPALWWNPKTSQWVRVQFERGLARRLKVRPETIDKKIAEGQFRRIEVKPFAAAKKVLVALEADGVERFAKWLEQKRASEPRGLH